MTLMVKRSGVRISCAHCLDSIRVRISRANSRMMTAGCCCVLQKKFLCCLGLAAACQKTHVQVLHHLSLLQLSVPRCACAISGCIHFLCVATLLRPWASRHAPRHAQCLCLQRAQDLEAVGHSIVLHTAQCPLAPLSPLHRFR